MKYIAVSIKHEGKEDKGIFGFPEIINHSDFAEMIKYYAYGYADECTIIGAGFMTVNNYFHCQCGGRSETLDIGSNASDSALIDRKKNEYVIITASGEVEANISKLTKKEIGDKISYDFILPEVFDSEKVWEEVRHVKFGSGYNWCRPLRDWSIVHKNP